MVKQLMPWSTNSSHRQFSSHEGMAAVTSHPPTQLPFKIYVPEIISVPDTEARN